jgi:alginate O-acetyltransferase complex protein AlgI
MNFASPFFAFVVLPLVIGTYWLCPAKWQNSFLLVASIALYAWGAPEFIVVVLLFAVLDWLLAFRIAAAPAGGRQRRVLTAVGVIANLGVLIVAKYANFGVGVLNDVRGRFDLGAISWTNIALPIGVSFITFEKISYLVDVSRGAVKPLRSLSAYLLYTFLFPKMFAGPIVRFHTIEHQLALRTVTHEDRSQGLARFAFGLAKKALIADTLGSVSNEVFAIPPGELNMPAAWLGIFCFVLQVYFDFDGYSDMAIGMGRCLGFRLPENFRHPYAAASPRAYWAGWHMSLSAWIRDYLYIPLGGSRRGELRTLVNLWICFLTCGLWHGANWTFVAWGALQGVGLTIERYFARYVRAALPRALAVGLTFTFVSLTLVVFRSPSMAHAIGYYRALFSAARTLHVPVLVDNVTLVAFAAGCILSFAPALPGFATARSRLVDGARLDAFAKACAVPLLILAAARTVAEDAAPFIYFRF